MQVQEARPALGGPPAPPAGEPDAAAVAGPRHRRLRGSPAWLAVSLTALAGLALLAAGAGRARWGPAGASGRELVVGGGVVVAGALVAAVALAVRQRVPLWAVPSAVGRSWGGDLPGWAPAGLGTVVGLPFLAMAGGVVWDADSARLLASIDHVLRFGPGYLVRSQEVVLPEVVLGPAVAVGGIAAARVVTLLLLAGLSGTVAYLAWRLNRSLLAAVAAPLALVSLYVIAFQANRLPMYLLMLALGYLGGWLASRAIDDPGSSRWRFAVGAAVALVLAGEAHAVGQLFLGVPVLLFLVGLPPPSRWRSSRIGDRLRGLLAVGVAAAVALVPRLVVNLSDGGLHHLRSNRTDYWVDKGYLALVNRDFWGHPTGGRLDYLGKVPHQVTTAVGADGVVVAILAVAALLLARGRARWFGVVCAGLMVGALLVRLPPPFPRYLAPLLPGLALAAAAAPALLVRRVGGALGKVAAGVAVAALAVGATTSWVSVLNRVASAEESLTSGPLPDLAARIEDDRGIIGARVGRLLYVRRGIPVWGTVFLSEREFVTYLTWPSDAEVVRVLRRHDIGWALVSKDWRREVAYHDTWLRPAYGTTARHPEALFASPAFCLTDDVAGYVLYRLGPCRPGDVEGGS